MYSLTGFSFVNQVFSTLYSLWFFLPLQSAVSYASLYPPCLFAVEAVQDSVGRPKDGRLRGLCAWLPRWGGGGGGK